jgi:hypothetical protein
MHECAERAARHHGAAAAQAARAAQPRHHHWKRRAGRTRTPPAQQRRGVACARWRVCRVSEVRRCAAACRVALLCMRLMHVLLCTCSMLLRSSCATPLILSCLALPPKRLSHFQHVCGTLRMHRYCSSMLIVVLLLLPHFSFLVRSLFFLSGPISFLVISGRFSPFWSHGADSLRVFTCSCARAKHQCIDALMLSKNPTTAWRGAYREHQGRVAVVMADCHRAHVQSHSMGLAM